MRIRPAIGALSLCFLIGCEEEREPAPGQLSPAYQDCVRYRVLADPQIQPVWPHLTDEQRLRFILGHCGEPY